jgi:hypothetical protein
MLRRSSLLKLVAEGKIEGRLELKERREKRHKQLLDDFKETSGHFKLKGVSQDRTL